MGVAFIPRSGPAGEGLTGSCCPAVLLEWGPAEISQPLPQVPGTCSVMKKMIEGLPGWWDGREVGVAPCRPFPTHSVLPPPHRILQACPPLAHRCRSCPPGSAVAQGAGTAQELHPLLLCGTGVCLAHGTLIFHIDKPRLYPPLVLNLAEGRRAG